MYQKMVDKNFLLIFCQGIIFYYLLKKQERQTKEEKKKIIEHKAQIEEDHKFAKVFPKSKYMLK